jgi:agmatinase
MNPAFDPNGLGIPNGQFFGFPHTLQEAKVVFLPVPWDVTTSYRPGTALGPQAILEASYQLDWYDFDCPQAWKIGYGTVAIDPEIQSQNQAMRQIARAVIDHLEQGKPVSDPVLGPDLKVVNQASEALNQWVYDQAQTLLSQGQYLGLVGGDHSVPLGYIRALAEKYQTYGILHIDAHADLRRTFEGFTYSHASIMYHVLQVQGVSHLVQVGIRDLCEEEMEQIQTDDRVTLFEDWQLKENQYQGKTWATQCQEIIAHLPQQVYISFDIDGLNPAFCPHTGTPVPGGLDFNQVIYLMQTVVRSGRQIIGFDLCEVAPNQADPEDQWDGNVGARILYKLANLMCVSQGIA